jgi:hypothetical protein
VTAFSVPDWLLQVAAVLGAFTAIIVFWKTVSRTRFGEWVKKSIKASVSTFFAEQTEPLRGALVSLEEKNDRQHAENKKALNELTLNFHEHRLETRDHLFEIRQQAKKNHAILEAHFGEAQVRDARLTALESGTSVSMPNVDLTITATPASGEVPAVEKD